MKNNDYEDSVDPLFPSPLIQKQPDNDGKFQEVFDLTSSPEHVYAESLPPPSPAIHDNTPAKVSRVSRVSVMASQNEGVGDVSLIDLCDSPATSSGKVSSCPGKDGLGGDDDDDDDLSISLRDRLRRRAGGKGVGLGLLHSTDFENQTSPLQFNRHSVTSLKNSRGYSHKNATGKAKELQHYSSASSDPILPCNIASLSDSSPEALSRQDDEIGAQPSLFRRSHICSGASTSSALSTVGGDNCTAKDKKRRREFEKKTAKEEKKRRREEIKALNAKKKEDGKMHKQQEQHFKKQRKGVYAEKEILVLLDPPYYDHLFDLGFLPTLAETYMVMKLDSECPSSLRPQARLNTFLHKMRGRASAMLWARQTSLGQYWPPSLEHMRSHPPRPVPYMVLHFSADQLMQLSEHAEGPSTALISMLNEAKEAWVSAFKHVYLKELPDHSDSLMLMGEAEKISLRMIVVFEEVKLFLNRSLLNRQHMQSDKRRKRVRDSGSYRTFTESDLQDWMISLFVELGVDVKITDNAQETSEYLASLTRFIASAPYTRVTSHLLGVTKLKSRRMAPHMRQEEDEGNREDCLDDDTGTRSLSDMWLHFLQVVPGIGELKAQKIMDHFPTLKSLLSYYRDPSVATENKERILADKMGDKVFVTLSERIYKAFTSTDPYAELQDSDGSGLHKSQDKAKKKQDRLEEVRSLKDAFEKCKGGADCQCMFRGPLETGMKCPMKTYKQCVICKDIKKSKCSKKSCKETLRMLRATE